MSASDATKSLASRIYRRAHLTGEFRLRSGALSSEYFDKYRFEADPALLRDTASALVGMLPSRVDALAGLELGGVPLATMAERSGSYEVVRFGEIVIRPAWPEPLKQLQARTGA